MISRLEIAIDEKTAHENCFTLLNSRTSLIDSPGIDDAFRSEQVKALIKENSNRIPILVISLNGGGASTE